MEQALLDWYRREGRDLPWRRTRDPYAVLVSEVMLQQTQVGRVIERWQRWLARWPTAGDVAAATPGEVLAEWVGLGYNRRALRLREACVVVAREGWPPDLTALPGVGRYTADAVRAFAYGEAVVPVDTNVARVFARAGEMEGPAELGQAVMDLGATICTARRPRCGDCPLSACPSRGRIAPPEPAPARPPSPRFEETDRWARGRVVAALAGGQPLPTLEPIRRERVLAGLARDGLVVREGQAVRLP